MKNALLTWRDDLTTKAVDFFRREIEDYPYLSREP